MNRIELNASRMQNAADTFQYMRDLLPLPDYFGHNLDALYDVLTEISEDTLFVIQRCELAEICRTEYAFRVLKVIYNAVEENPYLHLRFSL